MAVGIKVHFFWYPIGSGSFLHSFFSTITYHLEPNGWGCKYPYLMKHVCSGKIENAFIPNLEPEIREIRSLLKDYSPTEVVWDVEDLSKQPPWGDKISPSITNLSNYFVTGDGEDLFAVFLTATKRAIEFNADLVIKSL